MADVIAYLIMFGIVAFFVGGFGLAVKLWIDGVKNLTGADKLEAKQKAKQEKDDKE